MYGYDVTYQGQPWTVQGREGDKALLCRRISLGHWEFKRVPLDEVIAPAL